MKAVRTWIQKADDAMKRAARRAREVAAQTKTPVHFVKGGKIVKLMPGGEKEE